MIGFRCSVFGVLIFWIGRCHTTTLTTHTYYGVVSPNITVAIIYFLAMRTTGKPSEQSSEIPTNRKAVISLARIRIHKFTKGHCGTVPIRWCLL